MQLVLALESVSLIFHVYCFFCDIKLYSMKTSPLVKCTVKTMETSASVSTPTLGTTALEVNEKMCLRKKAKLYSTFNSELHLLV